MKIAIKENIVISAGDNLRFLPNGILKGFTANYNTSNCTIVDNVTLPDNFIAGCFTYTNGTFTPTADYQTRLDEIAQRENEALTSRKQFLLDSIEPLQQRVFSKNSDVWTIKFQDSENDDDLTDEEKKANKDLNKKVIKWRKKVRQQNNNITIDNTLEEIQARIDRINELDEIFPEIER